MQPLPETWQSFFTRSAPVVCSAGLAWIAEAATAAGLDRPRIWCRGLPDIGMLSKHGRMAVSAVRFIWRKSEIGGRAGRLIRCGLRRIHAVSYWFRKAVSCWFFGVMVPVAVILSLSAGGWTFLTLQFSSPMGWLSGFDGPLPRVGAPPGR